MRIVLTGGPCAGKTAVVEQLDKKGYNVIPEPARLLIEKYKKESPELLPHISKENRILFAKAIEEETIKNYEEHKVGYFDRSILDEIGYRNLSNIEISEKLDSEAKNKRYDVIFHFPFWKEIYKKDEVRHESPEESEKIGECLYKTYVKYGYTPIIVPKTSIEERVNFILNKVNNGFIY